MPRRRLFFVTASLALAWALSAGCQAQSAALPAGSGPVVAEPLTMVEPDLRATLSAAGGPVYEGAGAFDLYLVDGAGQPILDATVTFDLDMTNMSMGVYQVEAPAVGAGHYAARVSFSMPGPWRLIALIDRPGQAQAKARFEFDVAAK